ncbi:MAG: DUF1559 domain-containing protein, partial [Planctomycetales bacterium]|nr:DUF1559 domain-containing protein [Planctomycetales bacterium]
LVELLVVIAIIGVLVALLLPAIQAAREAARRTDCKNRLRQVGLAMQNHESSKQTFPTGGVHPWPNIVDYSGGGRPFSAPRQGLSWAFQLLPYLEQNAVHDLTTTLQLEQTPVGLYFCPSRRPPTQNPISRNWLLDYAGIVPIPEPITIGKTWDDMIKGRIGCRNEEYFWGGSDNIHRPNPPSKMRRFNDFNGVIVRSSYYIKDGDAANPIDLGYHPPVGFSEIEDGSSNTIVIGEKWLAPSAYADDRWFEDKGWSDGWDPDVMRSSGCQPTADSELEATLGPREPGFYLGSAHPSGLNVVGADASVSTLSYDIDLPTLNRLAHRSDGQITER